MKPKWKTTPRFSLKNEKIKKETLPDRFGDRQSLDRQIKAELKKENELKALNPHPYHVLFDPKQWRSDATNTLSEDMVSFKSPSRQAYVLLLIFVVIIVVIILGFTTSFFVFMHKNNENINQIQNVYGSVKAASTGPVFNRVASNVALATSGVALATFGVTQGDIALQRTTNQIASTNNNKIIDGVAIDINDRVLLKDETNSELNGIYVLTNTGYQRANDMSRAQQITSGTNVYVQQGLINGGAYFTLLQNSVTETSNKATTSEGNRVTGTGINFPNSSSLLLGSSVDTPPTGFFASYDPTRPPSNIKWVKPKTTNGTVKQVDVGPGFVGGPITLAGTISFDTLTSWSLWGNPTSTSAGPQAIDIQVGQLVTATPGFVVSPGNLNQVVTSQGSGLPITWSNLTGTGTVTKINTNHGLTGGPITTSGTIAFDTLPTFSLWGNSDPTSTQLPTSISLAVGEFLTATDTNFILTPGIAGQVLASNGPGQPVSWQSISGTGSVTQVNTGVGLTGGPITDAGTISFADFNAYEFWGNPTSVSNLPKTIPVPIGSLISNNNTDLTLLPGLNQILASHTAGNPLTWDYINSSNLNPLEITGTGKIVLSDTPQFISPELGTVQQGILTSCTGYLCSNLVGTISLTSQVSNILSLVNYGTGADLSTGIGNGSLIYKTSTVLGTSDNGSGGVNGQLMVSKGGSTAPSWLSSGNSGQVLQSNGSGNLPTWINYSAVGGTGVVTRVFTASNDQILTTGNVGNITLSLPQSIASTSSLQFIDLTVTGALNAVGYTSNNISEVGGIYYGNQFSNIFYFSGTASGTDTYLNSLQPTFQCDATGTRTNVENGRFNLSYTDSGTPQTITNAYTVHILAPPPNTTGVTVTNRYSLRIDDASSNSGLTVESLLGNVGIGTFNAPKKLEIIDTSGAQVRFSYDDTTYSDIELDSTGTLNITTTAQISQFLGDLGFTVTADFIVVAGNPAAFSLYTPPSNCVMVSAQIKCWGGGGGGGGNFAPSSTYGGGGGYAESNVTLATNVTNLYIVNGYPGRYTQPNLGTYAKGGTLTAGRNCGSGGGASFVASWNGTTMTVLAVGGGGGGAGNSGTFAEGVGAGNAIPNGLWTAANGFGQTGSGGIGGATGSSATPGSNMPLTASGGSPTSSLALLGGSGGNGGVSAISGGGGGGGGGYGGGGGTADNFGATGDSSGGGGGNYGTTSTVAGKNGDNFSGFGRAGNNTDPDYYPNAGQGGAILGDGYPGAVVVRVTLLQSLQHLLNYRVFISTNRAQAPGAGATDVSFDPYLDSEYADPTQMFYDPLKFHAPTPSANFVVPTGGGGIYSIKSTCRVNNDVGYYAMYISKNGTNQIPSAFFWGKDSSNVASTECQWRIRFAVGDIIRLVSSRSNSSGWVNMTFCMERIC